MIFCYDILTPEALARKKSCSCCGADMKCCDGSSECVVRTYTAVCKKYSNRSDTLRVWGTDLFYRCSSLSCGIETFTDTETRTERLCDH